MDAPTRFERLLARLDVLLPTELKNAEPDRRRRARLALFFPGVVIAPGPLFVLLFFAQHNVAMALHILGVDVLVVGVIPVLRLTRSVRAAAVYFATVFTVTMAMNLAGGGGGIFGIGVAWLAAIPLIALLTDGMRAGRAAFIVVMLAVGYLTWRGAVGLDHPIELSTQELIGTSAFTIGMLFATLFGIGVVFDSAQRRAHREVMAREQEVRLLLDNSGQGFATMTRDGTLVGARSAILGTWFGAAASVTTLPSLLRLVDARAADGCALELSALVDAFMPDEVILDQIPKRVRCADRTLGLQLRPIGEGATFLIVVTDVTAEIARERSEAAQREMVAVTEHAVRDPRGLKHLVEDADRAMVAIQNRSPETFRLVHTLKGNLGLFGVSTVASVCHELETALVDGAVQGVRTLTAEQTAELAGVYGAFRERVQLLLRGNPNVLDVPRKSIQSLRAKIERREAAPELLSHIDSWELEPVEQCFMRLGAQARALASRLGKVDIDVDIDAGDAALPAERFAPFWAAAVHLIRNAVDHGFENQAERAEAGKSARGKLALRCQLVDGELAIAFADDGRGIDWARLAERARRQSLPYETEQHLVDALFIDGVSTRSEVTDVSGRGVGLAAVAAIVDELSGTIDVHSDTGGTIFTISFPATVASLATVELHAAE